VAVEHLVAQQTTLVVTETHLEVAEHLVAQGMTLVAAGRSLVATGMHLEAVAHQVAAQRMTLAATVTTKLVAMGKHQKVVEHLAGQGLILAAAGPSLVLKMHLEVVEHLVAQGMTLVVMGTILVVVGHLVATGMRLAAAPTTLVAWEVIPAVVAPSWKAMRMTLEAMGTTPLRRTNLVVVHHLVGAEKAPVAKEMNLVVVGHLVVTTTTGAVMQITRMAMETVLEVAKGTLQRKLVESLMVVATAVNLPACSLVCFLL